MRLSPASLIAKKRDGGELTADEIRSFVAGVVSGDVGDAQLGAFLMAVCWRDMTVAETSALTLAMRDSGQVLGLPSIRGIKVDKHSTGGVGDKVSLLLAPWVAAAGVPVPMISGRGLGHTGGTIDKLQSIPGYRTDLSPDEFEQVLGRCGFVMASASAEIAPADRRMYAIRDISGTVESIPLITSSILSKKLAEGIDALVMDVKCGRAAFMQRREDAERLMHGIVSTGAEAGIDVVGLLTDMDTPLGRAAGNALEVREIVDCLRGRGPGDLMELTEALAVEMLVLGGVAPDEAAARTRLAELLASGEVERVLVENLRAQGGDPSFLEDPDRLGRAAHVVEVRAAASGAIADIDPLAVGRIVCELGGGRVQPTDPVDPLVGIVLCGDRGDPVAAGDVIALVHASDADSGAAASKGLAAAIQIADEAPEVGPLVLARASSTRG